MPSITGTVPKTSCSSRIRCHCQPIGTRIQCRQCGGLGTVLILPKFPLSPSRLPRATGGIQWAARRLHHLHPLSLLKLLLSSASSSSASAAFLRLHLLVGDSCAPLSVSALRKYVDTSWCSSEFRQPRLSSSRRLGPASFRATCLAACSDFVTASLSRVAATLEAIYLSSEFFFHLLLGESLPCFTLARNGGVRRGICDDRTTTSLLKKS